MRNILIGCALLAGVGTVVPMQASAQDLELEIGRDGLRIERDCNPRYEDCYRSDCRDDRRTMRRFCTEGRALGKAERMGIRRARIADVGRRDHRGARTRPLRRAHLCHLRPAAELPDPELTTRRPALCAGRLSVILACFSPSARAPASRRRPCARR